MRKKACKITKMQNYDLINTFRALNGTMHAIKLS